MTVWRKLQNFIQRSQFTHRASWSSILLAIFLAFAAPASHAQNLNWEGQTGAFVTPFAYMSPSSAGGFGLPAVSFHYLDGGNVLGGFYEVSATVGFLKRFEAGYSRALNSDGSVPTLSPLFNGGFNIFHAKANLLGENAGNHNYVPAISLGFVARTDVRRVGGVLKSNDTHNEDFYLVATKTITYFRVLPIVANFGFKVTNASVLGIAGNAPDWQGRLFGAVGFVLPAPKGSKVVLGSEFLQEPHHIEGLPGATLPTTLTYFARVTPHGELPLNIDFGVAQVANRIMPGTELHARAQFALGVSYRF
ncbi:MAG TPA: DUF3034 family protein [Candidatus Sulfotelmatobacter sp.]|nr:DUF3034 family protein [Candidatus Sulfotelmatobacter sp.]